MNIFNKVALQGLKKSRTRTIVTVIGVVLSAAMITAVTTFAVSLQAYMVNGSVLKYGSWHVGFLDVDSSFAEERIRDEEAADAAVFQNIGYAALDGAKNPDRPYLFIAGFHEKTFDTLPITLLSGRLPQNSSELLVSGKIASDGGVSIGVGDTLSLTVGSRMNGSVKLGQKDPYQSGAESLVPHGVRTYTVVGVCQTPVFEQDVSPGYTLITRADEKERADEFSLFVELKNPARVHSYAGSAAAGHAVILNDNVLRFMGLSDDSSSKIFNALLLSVGGIVIAIIMTGSVFLIYNSFSISLNERTRQIGILASVGATAKQLRNSVLFEGVCIGAVGIPIGILAGIGSIGLVIWVVSGSFGDILYTDVPLTLKVSVPAIILAMAVSIVTILISAYIPAKKAAGMPVMECIRQTNEVKLESKAVKTSKLAHKIYGLEGILALKNFKRNKKRYRSIVLSLVLSIVLFISTSSFVMNMKQFSEQARVVTDYDIGFGTQEMEESELLQLYDSMKNAAGVTGSSCQIYAEYTCKVPSGMLTEDYRKAVAGNLSEEAAEEKMPREEAGENLPKKTEGGILPDTAEGTSQEQAVRGNLPEETGGTSQEDRVALPVKIQFLDENAYGKLINSLGLPAEEYTGQNGRVIAVAKMVDSNNEAEGVEQLPDLFTASSMELPIVSDISGNPETEQRISVKFVETVPPDAPPMTGAFEKLPYFFQVIAPWPLWEKLVSLNISGDVLVRGMTFQTENPSQTAAEMKTMIQGAAVSTSYIFMNTSKMLDENRNMIFIANVFAYIFIIMISLIAVANVFNTISTNIRLRRQELAMLRSVGMSDRDFNKMMRFECVFYGMRALLFGLPLAAVFSWLIYRGMFIGGATSIHFSLPWGSIGISVFSVLLIIFITMMYAVGKIKKENIIDALRDNIT